MSDVYYTHAMWKVKSGNEAEFIEAWGALADVFLGLPQPPGIGTLIQSTTDPTLFYSFGRWDSPEDIQAMRADPTADAALQRLRDLCDDAKADAYRMVLQKGH
jgi:heme-degrading monooxygenase HmoA